MELNILKQAELRWRDDLEQIANFVLANTNYSGKKIIKRIIAKHLLYKTCIVVKDNNENIVAVARWNVSDDGTTAHVLDVIIRPDRRNCGFIKMLIHKGVSTFPSVKFLSWERLGKYPTRKKRIYSIAELLKSKGV